MAAFLGIDVFFVCLSLFLYWSLLLRLQDYFSCIYAVHAEITSERQFNMSDPIEPNMAESKAHGDTPAVEKEFQVDNVGDNNIDEKVDHDHDEKTDYKLDENAKVADYKADAIEAENAEHNMTVLEAVRAYPMASFWAFVMSFTIVSFCAFCFVGFSVPS